MATGGVEVDVVEVNGFLVWQLLVLSWKEIAAYLKTVTKNFVLKNKSISLVRDKKDSRHQETTEMELLEGLEVQRPLGSVPST